MTFIVDDIVTVVQRDMEALVVVY